MTEEIATSGDDVEAHGLKEAAVGLAAAAVLGGGAAAASSVFAASPATTGPVVRPTVNITGTEDKVSHDVAQVRERVSSLDETTNIVDHVLGTDPGPITD